MSARWGIVVSLLAEGAREKRGADFCRKWQIGYARRRLGTPVRGVSESAEEFEARVDAAAALRDICRQCGLCPLCAK
jgi:hypothetical protein